jgi:glycosyltransferase involved in cell wall biosynthesis
VEWGRRQLSELAPYTELAIAVSAYNEAELVEAGYGSTAVAPVLVDPEAFDREVDSSAMTDLQRAKDSGGSDWLFVGRISPNKCQHDIVSAFAAYVKVYDPKARLHLVGGSSSHAYSTTLERYVAALDLTSSVTITGSVPTGVLAAHFRTADVFVCLSEHEGFCVPLLEAMHHELPIVAFEAAAVPEMLRGGAGVLLRDKSPLTVATAVHRVLSDQVLGQTLGEGAQRRLAELSLERTRARWMQVLEPLGLLRG